MSSRPAPFAAHRAGEDAAPLADQAFARLREEGLLRCLPGREPQAAIALAPLVEGMVVELGLRDAAVPGLGGAAGGEAAGWDADALVRWLEDVHGLRPREAEVLVSLRSGGTNAELADQLGISPGTVRKHLQNAYATLGIRGRTEALLLLGDAAGGA